MGGRDTTEEKETVGVLFNAPVFSLCSNVARHASCQELPMGVHRITEAVMKVIDFLVSDTSSCLSKVLFHTEHLFHRNTSTLPRKHLFLFSLKGL